MARAAAARERAQLGVQPAEQRRGGDGLTGRLGEVGALLRDPRLLMAPKASSVLYVQHVRGHGSRLFDVAAAADLEGIVAKVARA